MILNIILFCLCFVSLASDMDIEEIDGLKLAPDEKDVQSYCTMVEKDEKITFTFERKIFNSEENSVSVKTALIARANYFIGRPG